MTKNDKKLFYSSLTLASLTGISIFVFEEFFSIETPFGTRSNPYLNEIKLAHFLTSPLLLFAFGGLWVSHVKKMLAMKSHHKKSGLSICILLVALTLSGQSLLAIIDQTTRNFVAWVHLIVGVVLILAVINHRYRTRKTPGT